MPNSQLWVGINLGNILQKVIIYLACHTWIQLRDVSSPAQFFHPESQHLFCRGIGAFRSLAGRFTVSFWWHTCQIWDFDFWRFKNIKHHSFHQSFNKLLCKPIKKLQFSINSILRRKKTNAIKVSQRWGTFTDYAPEVGEQPWFLFIFHLKE